MLIKKIGTLCNEHGVLEDGKVYDVTNEVGKYLIGISAAEKYEGKAKETKVEFEVSLPEKKSQKDKSPEPDKDPVDGNPQDDTSGSK